MSTEPGRWLLPNGPGGVSIVVNRVRELVRGVAFWVAALLPLSYVPMLYTVSITFAAFTKLVLLNVVALVVGHGYGADRDERSGRAG